MSCPGIGKHQSVFGYSCLTSGIFLLTRARMKSFLAVCTLFLIAAVVRGDVPEDVQKYIDSTHETFVSCATEVGLPTEMIGNMPSELSDEDKNKIGCMHSCVMKKANIWDGSQFDMDKMKEMTEKIYEDKADGVMKIIETCIEEVKDAGDDCTVAYMLITCAEKKME